MVTTFHVTIKSSEPEGLKGDVVHRAWLATVVELFEVRLADRRRTISISYNGFFRKQRSLTNYKELQRSVLISNRFAED